MLTLPGYQVDEELYATVNSVVYRGQRQRDQQPVVLKALNKIYPTPLEVARFRREYEVTRALALSGVIRALSLEPHRHSLVMVLEDFGADSLKRLMARHAFTIEEALTIAIQVAEALAEVHQKRVMHKDINPSNIVLNPTTRQLKLIDFGISTVLTREKPSLRTPELLEGTLAYISPEQTGRMNRAIDYRTDFYSLGITLYELLTGRTPFESEDPLELVHAHIAKYPAPPIEVNPAIPQPLSDITLKLLAKTAEARYQSAHGLKADLEEVLTQLQSNGQVTPFPLGRHDSSSLFQLPQTLYGREEQIAALLGAFERVSQGATEMMLVFGYAGVGKTALINELHKPIVRQRGYFISGKFDQFQQNIPYTALIQAFRELIRQLLTESDEQVERWRAKLQEALGPNGQIIIEVIPEVELIIGAQPPVAELSAAESQNRFQLLFQNFIGVFAQPEHPLAIFLDDLQWADAASLRLLQLFMAGDARLPLFLLGAYRQTEVDETHPLALMLGDMSKAGVTVTELFLHPLSREQVTRFVVDTLHVEEAQAAPLAQIVFDKTHGNPFFVGEFLKTLYQERLLRFVASEQEDTQGWQWELKQVQAQAITDNVIELMQSKLQKLPETTQDILKLAACIGNEFDLPTLAVVYEHSPVESASALWPALQEGLVVPLGGDYKLLQVASPDSAQELVQSLDLSYRFLHDRVQQAAYDLISEEQRQVVHLQIGRLLLRNSSSEEREEHLFEILNHLNSGATLITEAGERQEMARLNLVAGQKAKAATAYGPALQYLTSGMDYLGRESWQAHHELTLALHLAAAESAYLSGDFSRMEQLAESVMGHARTLLDKIKIYEIRIEADIAQYKMLEAVERARMGLALLGVSLPAQPTTLHTITGLVSSKLALGRKRLKDLQALPEMTDPYKRAAMRLLMIVTAPAYFVAPKLFPPIVFNMVQLSVRHGNAPASAYGYAVYGVLLCAIGDINSGYEFGQFGVELVERFNAKELKAKVSMVFNFSVKHWKDHIRETLAPFLVGYQHGLEAGDLEYAALNLNAYDNNLFIAGSPLPFVNEEMAKYGSVIRRLKQPFQVHTNRIFHQTVRNLLDQAEEPHRLVGESFNEEEQLPQLVEANDRSNLCMAYICKSLLCYHFGEYAEAVAHTAEAEKDLEALVGTTYIPALHHFYQSLALLADYPTRSSQAQKQALKKVAENQKKMKKWASHAPMNYQHRHELVEAERSRVQGNHAAAIEHYQRAILQAEAHDYWHEAALGNELAALYYQSRQMPQVAQSYLLDARHGYLTWGAAAKVRRLDEHYPELLPLMVGQVAPGTKRRTITPSSVTERAGALDLATVIKASQAISSELDLDRLLDKLMRIVIENAGAQKGVLLLMKNGQLVVEAEGSVDQPTVSLLQSTPVERSQSLSAAIVHYTGRTQRNVVLNDATQEGLFTADPYIIAQRPRSILCTPLLNQGQLIGVLYLENNLTTEAFTPERVEVVRLLGTQGAISITNAQAIATRIEKEILEQRARDLAELNASKDKFFSIISHDLRSPFGTLLGFSELMISQFDKMEREEIKEMVELIHTSGKGVLALLENLLEWSRIQRGRIEVQPVAAPLHDLVRQNVALLGETARNKGIELGATVDPSLLLYADPNMIDTVIRNLINNAIKFTRQGGQVWLSARATDGLIELSVTDTGVGISETNLRKLFRIDVTHTTTGTAKEQGTGLGLILCKELVEQNGGSIWAESTLGEGSVFRFTVPMASPQQSPTAGAHGSRQMG